MFMTTSKPGSGLRGPDRRQEGLRDDRGGTYDDGPPGQSEQRNSPRTDDEGARPRDTEGVRADDAEANREFDLPEGLKRERVGPYGKDTRRGT
jgi:hypothetical protein